MNNDVENINKKVINTLRFDLGHPLFRFIIAGLIASIVTFILLFLMRYLIMGYDRSATEAITQYFTLRTVVLADGEDERPERVARPGERPELPGLDEPDFKGESEAFLKEQAFDAPLLLSPQQEVKKELQSLQFALPSLSTREKLQQIKQEILSTEDAVDDSP